MVNGRRKGHSFEREIANKLKPIFPNARRLLEYQQGYGIDLENTGIFAIQCKRSKHQIPINKIKEIPECNKFPVLISKVDREQIYVTTSFECFYLLTDIYYKSFISQQETK